MSTEYVSMAGEGIRYACKKAIEMAKETGEDVSLRFNNIPLVVTSADDPESMASAYDRACTDRRKKHEESPEGIATKRDAVIRQRREANEIQTWLIYLEAAVEKGLDETVRWLSKYAPMADNNTVDAQLNYVAKTLESAGYVDNEFTGDAWVDGDKRILGRYIVGQAINCIHNGMPPHPGCIERFAAEYAGME